jgi:sec-independent protein translocase protein TatA
MPELLVVLAVILLLFGANRLPDLARSLGRSVSEFKKGLAESESGAAKQTEADAKVAVKEVEKTEADQGKTKV